MDTQHRSQPGALLYFRGALYIIAGIVLFFYANTFSAFTAHLLGALIIVAGAVGLISAMRQARDDRNRIWGILHAISDVAFGAAFWIYGTVGIKEFVDVLGFWATMYAFLQSVQAMYVMFASHPGAGMNYPGKVIHFANVFIAGALAFTLLLRPQGWTGSLGFAGIFPMLLGGLIIVLTSQIRKQTLV